MNQGNKHNYKHAGEKTFSIWCVEGDGVHEDGSRKLNFLHKIGYQEGCPSFATLPNYLRIKGAKSGYRYAVLYPKEHIAGGNIAIECAY